MTAEDPGGFMRRTILIFAAELTAEEREECRKRFKALHLPLREQVEALAYQLEMSKRADRLQPVVEAVEGRCAR
jgi:hypothetical protein